jgi:hypothetical protein
MKWVQFLLEKKTVGAWMMHEMGTILLEKKQ